MNNAANDGATFATLADASIALAGYTDFAWYEGFEMESLVRFVYQEADGARTVPQLVALYLMTEISKLRTEAASAGDGEAVAMCDAALSGDSDAAEEVAGMLADAAAMYD
jgi:hypothetical protein